MIPVWQSKILQDLPDVRHGFFGRQGGVSIGAYDSLNAGFSKGDILENVQENRRRLCQTLSIPEDRLVTPFQTHSDVVIEVTQNLLSLKEPLRGDAFVSVCPGVAIGILTADCTPILMVDPSVPVIGAVHAGWRGARAGVLENTLDRMVQLGGRADRIRAAVGPCIWPNSYEVRADFYQNFSDTPSFFEAGTQPESWQFDLPRYVQMRLRQWGVRHISASMADTCAHPKDFFSHRCNAQSGVSVHGNQLSLITFIPITLPPILSRCHTA